MDNSLKRINTICLIVLAIVMLSPLFIYLFTEDSFIVSLRQFPLDYSLYFAVLLGAIIVNYSMHSMKLLSITMLATAGGLIVYFMNVWL
ncbi:hypothetical protein [Halalkalibacter urbisdiaboli]|uniref:hypothetical protein n=1 Tax=Halalkalibacter urbisdiaboli TaxID=1960589 RepID=UPI000B4438FA|nr:hypothetical protein [Halalkalibacter urbisdiaboli]